MPKIIYCSNSSMAKTGFGIHARTLLTYLYKRGCDIVEYAAGYRWDDPALKKLPWKAHGTIPNNQAELHYCQNDAYITRNVHYGSHCFNRLLKENSDFDALIMCEDIWGVEHGVRRDYFPSINDRTMIITPVDSLPVLPTLEELAPKIKNLYVKAPFAQEALSEIGINHVKYMPVLIDHSQFFPIDKVERQKVRESYGIDDDTFVIGFCFRNQTRKLALTLLEAFSLFKKSNPNAKAKVFLHTNYRDGAAWDVPRAIKYLGLSPDDVITTYVCRKCHNIEVSPDKGDNTNCKSCGSEKSLSQTTTDFGCDEDELNVLFNTMDFYAQVVNSGGFECPSLQAMLCGLPSCATPYAGTKQFTDSGFVVPIKSSLDRFEENSGFRKAQPCPVDLSEIISKFYFMDKTERENFGLQAREYALDKFNPDKYCEEVYQWILSLPKDKEEINFTNERNEDFPFPDNVNDVSDFIKICYSKILNIKVDNQNKDLERLISEVSSDEDGKMKFYNKLISLAKHENRVERGLSVDDFIDDNGKKRLIYIIPCSIGDIFSSLSVIERLREVYDRNEWDIYVSSEEKYSELFSHLIGDTVKNFIPYHEDFDNFKFLEGAAGHKGFFDVAMHPYITTQRMNSYIKNGLDIVETQNPPSKFKIINDV